MKAVVLCAGFGTRLLPLTDRIAKPLLPVANRPMLDLVLDRLLAAGVDHVGINLHHKADQLLEHLQRGSRSLSIHTVVEPQILDTGGGIANFRDWVGEGESVLVHNSDIVTDIDISAVMTEHERSGADVTLTLVDDSRFNVVGVDADGFVTDIRGRGRAPASIRRTLCGIYVLSRRFLTRLEPGRKASVINAMVAQIMDVPGSVRGFRPRNNIWWRDLGGVESYLGVHREILSGRPPSLPGLRVPQDGILLGPDVSIASGARLEAPVVVGAHCVIGRDVHLADCVVLPGTRLCDGFAAGHAVILDDLVVSGGESETGARWSETAVGGGIAHCQFTSPAASKLLISERTQS